MLRLTPTRAAIRRIVQPYVLCSASAAGGVKAAQKTTIADAKEFFVEVVKRSYDDYMQQQSTFRTAFNVATALFHMHEWIYEFNKSDVEAKYSRQFATKGDFWQFVENQVPNAGYVRDLANASKHVRLTIRPSTGMTHVANTEIQSVGFGQGGFGAGRFSAPSVAMNAPGAPTVLLDTCAKDLYQFWNQLVADLYP